MLNLRYRSLPLYNFAIFHRASSMISKQQVALSSKETKIQRKPLSVQKFAAVYYFIY